MSVYSTLIKCSENHLKLKKVNKCNQGYSDNFRFDFKSKTISNGCKIIMQHGQLVCETIELSNGVIYDLTEPFISQDDIDMLVEHFNCSSDPFEIVKVLYATYKVSIPSKHTVKGANFKAKETDLLTIKEHLEGQKRDVALIFLEAFLLLGSIEKLFTWPNPNHYYLKLSSDLFLFRDWIIN